MGLGAGGSHEGEAKVSKLTEADDIEAYLTTFERLMEAFSVPKERWVFKLAPQLTGKAQQAYAALDLDKTADYDQVGEHPFTVQAAVSDRLLVPVLVGREVRGFDELLGATLSGGSTEATKVVAANPSQRGQQKGSEHARELGAIGGVPVPETGPWRDEPLGLTEPIVARRLSARQQEQIRRDTVVSQEKGGGV